MFLGLIARQPHDSSGYPWLSRDYLPSIPCEVSICPCNARGKCELPSNIKIRADGRCQTGVDFMEEAKKRNNL